MGGRKGDRQPAAELHYRVVFLQSNIEALFLFRHFGKKTVILAKGSLKHFIRTNICSRTLDDGESRDQFISKGNKIIV